MAAILGGIGAALCWGTSTFCTATSSGSRSRAIGAVGGLGTSYAALRRGKISIVAPICATEGAITALLFGISLYAAGRTGPALGAATILLGVRSLGVVVILVPLTARRSLRITRDALPLVVTSGLLELIGYGAYIAGVGDGDVAVPAVLSSLFAAVAGVLGFVLLGERVRSTQLAGVATILVGVVALSGLQ